MNVQALHRTAAAVIGAFAAVHVANHLVSLWGVPNHIAFMDAARTVYRQPWLEALLLLCTAFQASSGMWLVVRGWRQRSGLVAWLQTASGVYLALFLLVHVSAVLIGRSALGLDTNFYYAAAGFHVQPFQLFFAPYYFLAVIALFTHLGCAAYRRMRSQAYFVRIATLVLPMSVGAGVALLICLSLAGRIEPVHVPPRYKAIYMRMAG